MIIKTMIEGIIKTLNEGIHKEICPSLDKLVADEHETSLFPFITHSTEQQHNCNARHIYH